MTDTTKQQPKNHNKYRKDKPWDNDEIDHWKVPSWGAQNDEKTKDVLPGGRLLEESSFATLFPKYREHYLRSIWPLLTKSLDSYGIACELNLVEGSMTVRTTKATSDPYCILKARDLLKLLSRSIPFPQAVKILGDEWQCDIIKIGGMVRNKQRFIKRRQRLLGHDGSTLKALELLTGSYILVQGNTVSVMSSSWTGLKQTRRVVEDCMNNTQHPVYHLKRLMIVKELQKDETLVNQDWSRFLPKFQKRNVPRKKAKTSHKKQKKPYTPFPPPQQPSKIDLQLESGEYFLQPQVRDKNALSKKRALAVATSQAKRQRRDEELERPPPSSNFDSKKPPATTNITTTPIQERIKAKLQQQAKKNRTVADYGDFVLDRKGGEK